MKEDIIRETPEPQKPRRTYGRGSKRNIDTSVLTESKYKLGKLKSETMKTILSVPITKIFKINGELGKSSFIRIDEIEHNGNNAFCLDSNNGSYIENVKYFIQYEIEVIPV